MMLSPAEIQDVLINGLHPVDVVASPDAPEDFVLLRVVDRGTPLTAKYAQYTYMGVVAIDATTGEPRVAVDECFPLHAAETLSLAYTRHVEQLLREHLGMAPLPSA